MSLGRTCTEPAFARQGGRLAQRDTFHGALHNSATFCFFSRLFEKPNWSLGAWIPGSVAQPAAQPAAAQPAAAQSAAQPAAAQPAPEPATHHESSTDVYHQDLDLVEPQHLSMNELSCMLTVATANI